MTKWKCFFRINENVFYSSEMHRECNYLAVRRERGLVLWYHVKRKRGIDGIWWLYYWASRASIYWVQDLEGRTPSRDMMKITLSNPGQSLLPNMSLTLADVANQLCWHWTNLYSVAKAKRSIELLFYPWKCIDFFFNLQICAICILS